MKTLRFLKMGGVILAAALLSFTSSSDDDEDGGNGEVYQVTVVANGSGTAHATPEEAVAGEKVTLTATPDEGVEFTKWTVAGGEARLADSTAVTTTFTMPAGDVTVTAVFSDGEGSLPQYEDLLPLIQDATFKAYVEYRMEYPERINDKNNPAWDINLDGKLSPEEVANVTALNFVPDASEYMRQVSIEDLQYFTNVETLILDYNDVIDGMDAFQKLTKLVWISMQNMATPEGSTVDLSHCPDLSTLNFTQSYIYGVNVEGCVNLAEFNIEYTNISGELDLSECVNLTHFNATSCYDVTKIDLSACSALQVVELGDMGFGLEELLLPQNSRITELQIGSANISELDATQHKELTYLSCGVCPNLTKLDVTQCTKLQQLVCQYSPIGKLDLSHCPDVWMVWASNCALTELNVSGCTKLYELLCTLNNLTELDVTDLGFYRDENTGELTNTYTLNCGLQVPQGAEPEDLTNTQAHTYDPELWKAVSQEITVKMRADQKPYWDSSLASLAEANLAQNYKVKVEVVD